MCHIVVTHVQLWACRYETGKGLPGNKLTARETPGPDYHVQGAFEQQVPSTRRTSARPRIGSAHRSATYRQNMPTREAAALLYGRCTPGPMCYNTVQGNGAVGPQVVSNARSQPAWGFGAGDRFAQAAPRRARTQSARPASRAAGGYTDAHFSTPAPGAYRVQ